MGQILVRNIDDAVIERMKKRAKKEGRSLEAEVRLLIQRADKLDKEASLELIDRMRKRLKGKKFTDSVELIREDRDR